MAAARTSAAPRLLANAGGAIRASNAASGLAPEVVKSPENPPDEGDIRTNLTPAMSWEGAQPQEDTGMSLTNDDLAQLLSAIAQTPQFQFLDQIMSQSASADDPGTELTEPAAAVPEGAQPEQNALMPQSMFRALPPTPQTALVGRAMGVGPPIGSVGKSAIKTIGTGADIGTGLVTGHSQKLATGSVPTRYKARLTPGAEKYQMKLCSQAVQIYTRELAQGRQLSFAEAKQAAAQSMSRKK
jgi:hypothetical protein